MHAQQTQSQESSLLSTLIKFVVAPLALAAVTFFVYYQSVDYAFQFDDIANILKFFNIRTETLSTLFFKHARWIGTWLNAVNYRMGKGDPFAPHYYRLFNIFFHIFTSVVVFYFLYYALSLLKNKAEKERLEGLSFNSSFFYNNAYPIALFATTLFMLHPVQSQTVSYVIQGRLEGLAGLFILMMSLCFLLFNTVHNKTAKIGLGVLLFALAALSTGTKEYAFISPVLLLLVDWFFVAQGDVKSLKSRWMQHAGIALTVWGMYLYFLKPNFFIEIITMKKALPNNIGNELTENRTDLIKPWPFFISQFKVILHYLGIFLWPFNISVDYDWKMVRGFFAPDCLLPLMALLAIGGYILHLLRRNTTNMIAFGLLWFFITIAPRASFIPATELIADYKTYLACVGWLFVLAAVLVYGIQYMVEKRATSEEHKKRFFKSPLQFLPVATCAVLLGAGTYDRNKVWSSGEAFWANVLKNAPGRARAYNNYGVALSENGKYAEAIPHFKQAIKMDRIYPDPINNLAVAYSSIGKTDEAIEVLKQGLRIHPYYPEAHNNLASFYIQKKEYDNAEKFLDVAISLRPYYGKAHYNRARVALLRAEAAKDEKQKLAFQEKAWQSFKNAAVHGDFDNNIVGIHEYARLSMQLKKYDDAISGYKRLLTLNPRLDEALFLIANALFFKGESKQAVAVYEEFLRRSPGDIRGLNNLGEVYFQNGQPAKAAEYFAQVVKQKPEMIGIQLRLAECLDRLGKPELAKERLAALLKHKLPSTTETSIKTAMAEIDKHLGKSAPNVVKGGPRGAKIA